MMNTLNEISNLRCFQCNSFLVLISQETVRPEGSRFSQTNVEYRCSNEECQKEQDKQKAERMKQRQKKAAADQERLERIQEKKRLK